MGYIIIFVFESVIKFYLTLLLSMRINIDHINMLICALEALNIIIIIFLF
jgi:hypothetical protein